MRLPGSVLTAAAAAIVFSAATAARGEVPHVPTDAPVPVQVITKEELEKRSPGSAADLVRALPPLRAPSRLETDVLAEINRARTDPAAYARTLRGSGEAFDFLNRQPPIAPIIFNPFLGDVAARHAADQGPRGLFSHTGSDGSSPMKRVQAQGLYATTVAEEISLSQATAAGVVGQLIIDLTSPGRQHRADLFDPQLQFGGVGCGPNTAFHVMCVIDLTGRFAAHMPVGYDCDAGFYDWRGHPEGVPVFSRMADPQEDARRWKDSVKAFYQSAFTDLHAGSKLDGARADMCESYQSERAARADPSVADALRSLEEAGR